MRSQPAQPLIVQGSNINIAQPKQQAKQPQKRFSTLQKTSSLKITKPVKPSIIPPKQTQPQQAPQKTEPQQQVQQQQPSSPQSHDVSTENQFGISQAPINQIETVNATFPKKGQVVVKYSHYKDQFPITDGVLMEKIVDDQYCLSYVFKGNFKFHLKTEKGEWMAKLDNGGGWKGCEDGQAYKLEVEEDPEQVELERKNAKPFVAFKAEEKEKDKHRVNAITAELKQMSIGELQEKGQRYKELIEARDLEDILYH